MSGVLSLDAKLSKMEAALASLIEGVAFSDGQGHLEWCNEPFEQLIGCPREQVAGLSLTQILPLTAYGQPVPEGSHPVSLALRQQPTEGIAFDCHLPTGKKRTLELTVRPVSVEPGQTAVVVSARDVTLARERQARLVRNQGLLRLSQRVNEAANEADSEEKAIRTILMLVCRYTGWELGHASRCQVLDPEVLLRPTHIWHERSGQSVALRDAIAGSGRWWEMLTQWVVGHPGAVSLTEEQCSAVKGLGAAIFVPIRVGYETAGFLEFYDQARSRRNGQWLEWLQQIGIQLGRVVERKRAESELRTAYSELEARVADRTLELAETNETLTREVEERRRAERMKNELVAAVSHELRTPLTSLLGFAELMLDEEFERTQQREFLTIMRNESLRLSELINDFLDLQKIEAGRMEYRFQPLDIRTVLRDAASLFGNGRAKHRFVLHLPPQLPAVQADPKRIQQVVANLCSNAIKFSPDGGQITLRAEQERGVVEVSVSDEGIGMAPEVLPKLFQKFYRVDNGDTRNIGGTGLGLALIKEIVTAHQGRVNVESQLGKGSTFYFTLPVSPVPGPSSGF